MSSRERLESLHHDLQSPLAALEILMHTDLQDVPKATQEELQQILRRMRTILASHLNASQVDE